MRRGPGKEGRPRMGSVGSARRGQGPSAYSDLKASELYCPRCRVAVPVWERLLLVLPDGELYEYRCVRCGTSVGEKTSRGNENIRLVIPS